MEQNNPQIANDNRAHDIKVITWTATEVAAALGVSRATFDRKRKQLYDEDFPQPIPGLNGRWSVLAVNAWVAGDASLITGDYEAQIDRARQELEDMLA